MLAFLLLTFVPEKKEVTVSPRVSPHFIWHTVAVTDTDCGSLQGKCSLRWTLVLGTLVIQLRPRAPVSAQPRPLLNHSFVGMFEDRWQGLKICRHALAWTYQCVDSI